MTSEKSAHTRSLVDTMNFVFLFASFVGVRLIDADFRFNRLTFCTFAVISIFKVFSVYSIVINKHDIFRILETLCCYGLTIPSTLKLIGALQRADQLRSLFNFSLQVYRSNDTPDRSRNLYKSALTTKLVVRVSTVIFILSFFIFAAYPTYQLLFHGELTLFLALYIPYVDSQTFGGFAVHILMQLIMSLYAAAGNISFDLLMAILISVYRDLVSVLEFQLKRLAELYKLKQTQPNIMYRKAFMRNMLLQFNDTQEYVNTLNGVYALTVFIQIASSSVAITVSLFSIVANNWGSGYGFVLYSLAQIQVLCLLGTIISTQNQRLCDMIYATPWYLYDQVDKKLLLALLQMCQNSCEMWIGPLAPLNVETGTDIVRCIFRYYTMIVSFLE